MPRNIVLCLDGTSNEPETGFTNVARMFYVAVKGTTQLAYYDPGVGTMGARGAVTPLAKRATRIAGLVGGFGVKENIEEAYTFLMRHYEYGDQIFVFGFSRGAYTARALTGMLRTVGLLREGSENLVPYALKLYTKQSGKIDDGKDGSAYWQPRNEFREVFGEHAFPHSAAQDRNQIHFLGVWDTVKSVGWFNWRARFQQARWPFTATITNVATARHALAIDEKRRPYRPNRFGYDAVAASDGRYREVWFPGVHSDVGGQYPDDHRLSDIAFAWMVQQAVDEGFKINEDRYQKLLGVPYGDPLPAEHALGRIHHNGRGWWLAGGWDRREIREGDPIHPSVHQRIKATAKTDSPYRPRLPYW